MTGAEGAALYGVYLAGVFSKSVAKEAGKGVGKRLAEALTKPSSDVVGKAIRALGGAETPEAWRQANLEALGRRSARIARSADIRPRRVPLSFLYPVVEGAANVDDETLQEMWARLLVSGGQDARHRNPMWVDILRRLSPEDAQTLLALREEAPLQIRLGDDPRCYSLVRLKTLGVARIFGDLDSGLYALGSMRGEEPDQTIIPGVVGELFLDAVAAPRRPRRRS